MSARPASADEQGGARSNACRRATGQLTGSPVPQYKDLKTNAVERLTTQLQTKIVSRDRGDGYALAAAKALPQAIQVADRRDLMENAGHAFLDAVRKSMRQIRAAIGAATVDPELLTAAELLQYERHVRR